MGYMIETIDSTFTIPTANLDETYRRWCELNQRHDLKRGGTLGAGADAERWFSWMEPNYPETCADAQAIAEQLGFTTTLDDDGLHLWSYANKAGQEDLFLTVVSDLATGIIVWQGEEGERWRETYGDETVTVQHATLTFGEPENRSIANFQHYTFA